MATIPSITVSTKSLRFLQQVYASIYNPGENETKLLPITDEKEWKIIETVLDELQNEATNEEGKEE